MPNSIRFHLDENCDPKLATGLRLRGIDVTTTGDAGLLHAADEEHVAYVLSRGRVIFTQDADFLRMNAAGQQHLGIAYCHPESRSIGEVIHRLALIWEIYELDEMKNRIEYL